MAQGWPPEPEEVLRWRPCDCFAERVASVAWFATWLMTFGRAGAWPFRWVPNPVVVAEREALARAALRLRDFPAPHPPGVPYRKPERPANVEVWA